MKLLALATTLILLATSPARAELVEGVAAVVGDEVILLSELKAAADLMIARLEQAQGPLPPEAIRQIRSQALQGLIDSSLILRFAERVDLRAAPQEIDSAIAGIAADEGVSVGEIYAAAAQQGLSRARYRKELEAQITRMKVISGSVRSRVTVTDAEVRQQFEERYTNQRPGVQVRVRHILLPWPEQISPDERERMKEMAGELRARVIEGGNFADAARQYSRAPSAAQGGLTSFREGDVSPEIATQIFGLPPGDISPVIETAHGLNIFQIVERFDPSEVSFEDIKGGLRAELLERKTMPEFEAWLNGLRENQYIEIVPTELK